MVESLTLEFKGPFCWLGGDSVTSIFDAEVGRKGGVYLWTVSIEQGELIYYVGQTGRAFSLRMLEHFREHCSGGYHLYSPEQFAKGLKEKFYAKITPPAEYLHSIVRELKIQTG